jgi:hypothetical protein
MYPTAQAAVQFDPVLLPLLQLAQLVAFAGKAGNVELHDVSTGAVQSLVELSHTPSAPHVLLMLPFSPAGQAAVQLAPAAAPLQLALQAAADRLNGNSGRGPVQVTLLQLLTPADQLAVLLTPSTQVLLMLPAVPSGHWPVHTAPGNALLQLASQFVTLSG